MTSPKAETDAREKRPAAELGRRYGQIGISAVRAALPYRGDEEKAARARPQPRSRTA